MKEIIENLDKILENRIRLAIMSALMVNDNINFNSLKQMLDVTDGNLASHISMLEKNNYIKVKKKFIGKKPSTTYIAIEKGRRKFSEHLDALEKIINMRR